MLYVWLFIGSLLATVVIVPLVIVRLPSNYFLPRRTRPPPFRHFPAPARVPLVIAKNLVGLALVGVGIVFLVMPGQGVIVILIGVLLLDFPHKRRLEHWLISRGPILKLANWLRAKWHREPFRLK